MSRLAPHFVFEPRPRIVVIEPVEEGKGLIEIPFTENVPLQGDVPDGLRRFVYRENGIEDLGNGKGRPITVTAEIPGETLEEASSNVLAIAEAVHRKLTGPKIAVPSGIPYPNGDGRA